MNFGLGITLYQPEPSALDYLNTLGTLFARVYIFDNGLSNDAYKDAIGKECYYDFRGKNRGLSAAFNCFLSNAVADDIDYLLILDQDSLYKLDSLQKLMDDISRQPIDDDIAIRTCHIVPQHLANAAKEEDRIVEIETVISSGSFINIHAVKKHGLAYDEHLFVDYVDIDFCKNIRQKGLKILSHMNHVVSQQLGYYYKGRICHSAVRHYYMVRDLGYFNAKYYSKLTTELKSLRFLFKDLLIALKEDKSKKKILYALRGYRDYLLKKHGEYGE